MATKDKRPATRQRPAGQPKGKQPATSNHGEDVPNENDPDKMIPEIPPRKEERETKIPEAKPPKKHTGAASPDRKGPGINTDDPADFME